MPRTPRRTAAGFHSSHILSPTPVVPWPASFSSKHRLHCPWSSLSLPQTLVACPRAALEKAAETHFQIMPPGGVWNRWGRGHRLAPALHSHSSATRSSANKDLSVLTACGCCSFCMECLSPICRPHAMPFWETLRKTAQCKTMARLLCFGPGLVS